MIARACDGSVVACLTATRFAWLAAIWMIEPGSTFTITRCGML